MEDSNPVIIPPLGTSSRAVPMGGSSEGSPHSLLVEAMPVPLREPFSWNTPSAPPLA
jgi:hypothetical protein